MNPATFRAVAFEASERGTHHETVTEIYLVKGNLMRRIIIAFVCVMLAPLAFAQTKKMKVQQPTTTQPAASTETAGTVRKFESGKTMMIDSTQGPLSFALGANAQIVNNAGNAVTSPLKPGETVRVYYTGTDQNRMVDRVVVED